METMRAVVADPAAPRGVAFGRLPIPVPGPDEVLVRVQVVSLNPGELRQPSSRPRLGRDLFGTVEIAAANGQGPAVGTRVVGILPEGGAFAERAALPLRNLARVPDAVSGSDAAALPVAGLTALHALERGGLLLGRRVLVTGASGGVGHFGVQLARASGARVTAAIRRLGRAGAAHMAGARRVLVGAADGAGGQDFILDTVGGSALLGWLDHLEPGGLCVAISRSVPEGDTSVAPLAYVRFLQRELSLQSFYVFDTFRTTPPAFGLARLVDLVAEGELRPHLGREVSWDEVGTQVGALFDRDVAGKIILHLA